MTDKGYERYLQSMIKEEHALSHELSMQLQQQRNKNNKLLQQMSALRKKQNDNKIKMKQMQDRIYQLQNLINGIKNPAARKAPVDKANLMQRTSSLNSSSQLVDRKAIFKLFIADNYPKYKQLAKKSLSLILHIQRHAAKNPKDRIDAYYEIIGSIMKKFLNFILGKKTQGEKNKSIAEQMVQKWKTSEDRMRELMSQRNQYKIKQDAYIEQIQKLEGSQAKLQANKKGLQSKVFAYQNSLTLKGAQFAMHLKKMLAQPDQVPEEDRKRIQKIIQTMSELARRKSNRLQNNLIDGQQQKDENKQKLAQTQKIVPQNALKQMRPSSGIKMRKNAAVLKKNIFGYYQNPQLNNNQPNLTTTKHLVLSKCMQTTPEDLSILTARPVIMITIVDGKIKPQRNRHCINFYVKLNYNLQQKFYLSTKVNQKRSYDPIWNESFLIYGYSFPFFTLEVMNEAKGLKDYSIGEGRIQVTRTQIPKLVNIKNQGEHQGRVRLMITYPKGTIYLFIINSVKLVYPQTFPMSKDTLNIKVSLNPIISLLFQIGEKIKYFDDDYKGNNKFLILNEYDGDIKLSFDKTSKTGSIPLSQLPNKQGDAQIEVIVGKDWSVILSGVFLMITSQTDEPEPITQDSDQQKQKHKYFSLIANDPILQIEYNTTMLPSHVKLPLVFKFIDSVNLLRLFKKTQIQQNTPNQKLSSKLNIQGEQKQVFQISPIVIPNTNLVSPSICPEHLRQVHKKNKFIRAPKIIYQIKIQNFNDSQPVTLATPQYHFQKLVQNIELRCGYKKFTVQSKELLQNFYITKYKNFKGMQQIKFKIGYIIRNNLLSQQQKVQIRQSQIKIPQIQLQTLDSGEHYVSVEVDTAFMPQFSSTADYVVNFQFGNCNMSTKKTGNNLQWKQLFILPFNQAINVRIVQYTLICDKCIHQQAMILRQMDLKLKCKFLTFGQKSSCYVFLNNLETVVDLYSLKVKQIQGDFPADTDWIGQMDPFIRFTTMNRTIYSTQKLQGAGNKPIWVNDQFTALVPTNFINLAVYDDDLMGKDDYLGQCTVAIPQQPCTQLGGSLSKAKQPQKQHGRLMLDGQFNRVQNVTHYMPKQLNIKLPSLIYRIRIYKIHIDISQFSNSDIGYLSYRQNNYDMGLLIRSGQIERENQNKQTDDISTDFSIWVKQDMNDENNPNIVIGVNKIVKSLFSSKDQKIAYANIAKQSISGIQTISIKSVAIMSNSNSSIGTLHYIIQPVQSTRVLYVEGLTTQANQKLVLVSDTRDYVMVTSEMNNVDDAVQGSQSHRLLMYDENWHVLTEEQYGKYCTMSEYSDSAQINNLLNAQSKYIHNRMESLSMGMGTGLSRNMVINIAHRNIKQRQSIKMTPQAVLLSHEIEYSRASHPKIDQKQISDMEQLPLDANTQLYELTHITLKCLSTNKCVVTQNTSLVIAVSWQDYSMLIPVSCSGMSNMTLPQKLLRVYRGAPIQLQLTQSVKQNYKQYENNTVVLQEKFIRTYKQIGQPTKTSAEKCHKYDLAYVSSCFKYKSHKLLLDCQFMRVNKDNAQYDAIRVLCVPWMYMQVPIVNMDAVNGGQVQRFQVSEQSQISHKVHIQLGVQQQASQDTQMLSSVLVLHVSKESALIQGRCIQMQSFSWPVPHASNIILNTQLAENGHKFEPDMYRPEYDITCMSCSLAILREYKRRQLTVVQCVKSIPNAINMPIAHSLGRVREGEVRKQLIFTNKYNNVDMASIYGQMHMYKLKYSSTSPEMSRYVSRKCIVNVEELAVDMNDHVSTYNVDKHSLYVHIANSRTNCTRALKLELVDRDKWKYKLAPQDYNNRIVVVEPEQSTYRVEVWAIGKKGIIDRITNNTNRYVIGTSVHVFDKWETLTTETAMLQLKQAQESVQGGVMGAKGKAVGFIKLKYRCDAVSQQQCRELDIDRVALQLKSDQNTTQRIRIECVLANTDESAQKKQQQEEQEYPFSIMFAELSSMDYRNKSSKALFEYTMKQSIITSMRNTSMWPSMFKINIYDNKYNTQLGSFDSNQLALQTQAKGYVQPDRFNHTRWHRTISMTNVPQATIVGSIYTVLPLNTVLDPNNKKTAVSVRSPSDLQIEDKVGETIVQFSISNIYGMAEPAQGEMIYIMIQTSMRVIRSNGIKYFSAKNKEGKGQLVYCVHMYHKEMYNTKLVVSTCNRKGEPLYSAQLTPQQIGQIGYMVFYNPLHAQELKMEGNNVVDTRMPCGSCIYTVSLPNCPLSAPEQSTIKQGTSEKNSKIDILRMDLFVQISNIQVQAYQDTQFFGQMTPYLIVANKYSSSVGVGNDDLFWKMGLLMPISNSISTTVEIKMKDKDMFFDDYIGNSLVLVPPFNVQQQVQSSIRERAQSKQHTVLKLGQYTHVSHDLKNGDKLAGRIRVQYRYMPVLPVLILLQDYNRASRDMQVQYSTNIDMEKVYARLRKSRHRQELQYNQITQQIISIRINTDNCIEYTNNDHMLVLHKQNTNQNNSKRKSKSKDQVTYVIANGVELERISGETMDRLGVSNAIRSQQVIMHMTTLYKPDGRSSNYGGHTYKWRLTDPNNKDAKPLLTPISNNSQINNIHYVPCISLLSSQPLPLIYMHSFSMFLEKSKLNTVEHIEIYIMTQQCAITLVAGVNARMTMHGQGKYSQVVDIEPIDMIIPMSMLQSSRGKQMEVGDIRMILYDKQTGYSCSVTASTNTIIDDSYSRKKQNRRNKRRRAEQLVYADKYSQFSNSSYAGNSEYNRYNEYILVSRLYTTDKYQIQEEYRDEVGIMYINANILYSNQGSGELKQSNEVIAKCEQQASAIINSVPIGLPPICNTMRVMLNITIVRAAMLKDIQFFSKMDPYCEVYIRQQGAGQHKRSASNRAYRTQVQQNKGKQPDWNQSFYIDIPYLDNTYNNCDTILEWVVSDAEVTLDRLIGYGSTNISEYLRGLYSKQALQRTDMTIVLYEQQNKQTKTGDLYIRIDSPASKFIMFTNLHMHHYSNRKDEQIQVYYQQNKHTPKEKEQAQLDIDKIPQRNMKLIEPGKLYPLAQDVLQIKFIVKCKQIKKVYTEVISMDELQCRLSRAQAKVMVIDACMEIGYTLLSQQPNAHNLILKSQKYNDIKNDTGNNHKLKQNMSNDDFQFILDQQKPKSIDQNEQNAMFILEYPQQPQNKIDDGANFILGTDSVLKSQIQPKLPSKAKEDDGFNFILGQQSNVKGNQQQEKQKQIKIQDTQLQKKPFSLLKRKNSSTKKI